MGDAIITFAFGILGGVLGNFLTSLTGKASAAGSASATTIGAFVDKTVPSTLRPVVLSELKAMSTSGPLSAASVTGVAAAILAKIGGQFPTVVKNDVVLVLSDYVKAFDAGLANVT